MKKIIPLILLISGFSSPAFAAGNTFDPATNTLTIDSVTVIGNRVYSNVVIRLDEFTVLGVGSSTPIDTGVSETCDSDNFTNDKFNAIQVGMTTDQVNQVIGCKFSPNFTTELFGETHYVWMDSKDLTQQFITVVFNGAKVSDLLGSAFKFFQKNPF